LQEQKGKHQRREIEQMNEWKVKGEKEEEE